MKKLLLKKVKMFLRVCSVFCLLTIMSLFIYAFAFSRLNDDFLKELGIAKTEADKKICGSILGGSLDVYGVRHIKNIAAGNRSAVVKDLLLYVKKYVVSGGFVAEYAAMKENNKPRDLQKAESPDVMRANMIKQGKEFVQNAEDLVKKATPETKPMFEDGLKAAKQNLKDAEDPENKYIKAYAKNYEVLQKSIEQSNESMLKDWEARYPSNHLLFVKIRLQQFLDETGDIDFNAGLTEKNGKKFFANPIYERKSNRWKMAFRAGKEVIEPARAFVQQWINEIK
jgi:hypothetical protein